MNAERFLAYYDQIADTPDAIGRMRRFILDLAVRGKLVPQDRSDPAAVGFRRPTDPAAPFELPDNWKWIEIGEQLNLFNGMAFKPTDWMASGLKIVRIQNLNNLVATFNFCNPAIARATALIDDGSFLISWSGTPGTSFGAFIWCRGPAVLNQHIFRCDFKTKSFSAGFLRLAINGRLDEMIAKAHGGVGLQHITKGKLEALLIPLPPLAEQHHIVARVDELMGLCDRLEAAQANRETVRDRLAAASLNRLSASKIAVPTAGASPEPQVNHTSADHARLVFDALPALTARPDQIKALRQTILNLAVHGKLVPQDAKDVSAPELLDQIANKKADLLRSGFPNINEARTQMKKIAEQSVPGGLEILPPGWIWATLLQCSMLVIDCKNKTAPYSSSGIRLIRTTNVRDGRMNAIDQKYVNQDTYRAWSARCTPEPGDILITREAPMGEVCIIPAGEKICLGQRMMLVRLVPNTIDAEFMIYSLRDPKLMDRVQDKPIGATVQHLRVGGVETLLVPLPPLAEQHRIVAKLNVLMALCDKLEASLTAAADTRRRLLDALLAEVLAPDEDRLLEAAE